MKILKQSDYIIINGDDILIDDKTVSKRLKYYISEGFTAEQAIEAVTSEVIKAVADLDVVKRLLQ